MVNWGKSLPVPSVQALAVKTLSENKVPDRYVRPEAESEPVARVEADELPVIRLDMLMDPEHCHEELAKLNHACLEWGFFQVIDHGMSEELLEKVKNDVRGFFELPMEDKKEYKQIDGIEGYGQIFVTSEEQKLDWADLLVLFTLPPSKRNMKFWPTNPPNFRDTIDNYSSELDRVASYLFRSMDKNLGLEDEKDCLANKFKDYTQSMRFNIYPPCPKPSKVLGISPHSDAAGLTLLIQLNDVNGLQFKKDEKWFTIKPLHNALIVNVGDLVEIFTNGLYKSIEHRVVIDPTKERFSIATFASPEDSVRIGPLPLLVKDNEPNYTSVTHIEYMKTFFDARLNGKSILESMKINK